MRFTRTGTILSRAYKHALPSIRSDARPYCESQAKTRLKPDPQ
jgi:hypothetical protein